MLSSFISKLLLGRQIEWDEKGIKILGRDFISLPIELLMTLQNEIKNNNILYESAKETFLQFSKDMGKHSSNKEIFLKYMTSLIDHLGFGKIKILEIKDKTVKLQMDKNNFAEKYRKIFGKQKYPIDVFLAGILAGFFSAYFNSKVECKENSCIAQGKSFCSFYISP